MRIGVVGAGIVGPTLAHWLVRGGHAPTLIERAPRFRAGGYMIDFWGVGYEVAARMGVLPRLLRVGYDVEEVRFVDGDGRRTGGFPVDVIRRLTGGRFTSVPRGELARVLYAAIADRVETIFGANVSGIEEKPSGVRIHFARHAPREFDLVVGADGLHSVVRRLRFGPQERYERSLGYRVAVFDVEGYRPRDELVSVGHSTPGRLATRFALRDNRTMVLLVFQERFVSGPEPRDDREAKDLLRRIFADAGWECPRLLDAMAEVPDLYFDRVSQIHLPTWSRGRVVLIGDAAACVSLLAGEGAGLAMTQAYVLAGELASCDSASVERALARYERRLRPLVERKQKAARRFASTFTPATRIGIWLRDQATRLMALPPVARVLIGRNLVDDFELPTYELPGSVVDVGRNVAS
jgi:2-polyprenyl-6-methoxyphenol hydroxylase-like FAD-dependent oxidoreductase